MPYIEKSTIKIKGVEKSPSNRTKCAKCKKIIPFNSPRVVVEQLKLYGEYTRYPQTYYYHLECYKKIQKKLFEEARRKIKKEIII